MKVSAAILSLCALLLAQQASATCITAERLTGVNLAGAEFGKLPGRLHIDYIYPSQQELQSLADVGGNILRLPVRWERIRPSADGKLQASELEQIAETIDLAKALGLCVILDLHNYGKYHGEALKDNAALKTAFTDTWLKLAAALPDTEHVALGLMNEPIGLPVQQWAELAQSTLLQLREHDHRHLVLVAGGRWSGAHDWFSGKGADINAEAFADLSDPLDNYLIEVHQYADSDYSGTHDTCKETANFERIFTRLSEWATTHDHQLFLGEFGVARNPHCLETLGAFLELTRAAPWRGWTYWAAGRWWNDYPMAVSLSSTEDSPQWEQLRPSMAEPRND